MSTVITTNNHRLRTWFFVLGSILMFFLFRFYFGEQYPDWVSYKNIYENQDSYFRLNSYDFVFILILDICLFFNINYEYFRLILLLLTSWIFIKSLNQFNTKLVVFFTLLNLIFIFFQIRQGLAAALIYFSFHIISYRKKFLIDFIALLTHFGSMFFVIFASLKPKIIKRILLLILMSWLFFYDIINEFIIEYISFNYSQHAIELVSYRGLSKYYFITPMFYLIIVNKVAQGGLLKKFIFCLLLFIIVYPSVFPGLVIPSIIFNSIYRILIVYLSLMLLKRKLKPNLILFLVILAIISKDLISSQILYIS